MIADEFEGAMAQVVTAAGNIDAGIDVECAQDARNAGEASGDRGFFAAGVVGVQQVHRLASETCRQATGFAGEAGPKLEAGGGHGAPGAVGWSRSRGLRGGRAE